MTGIGALRPQHARILLLLCALGAAMGACGAPDSGGIGGLSGPLAQQFTVTLRLPPGVQPSDVALSAEGALQIGNRTEVREVVDKFATISNIGVGETSVGVDARVGDVYGRGKVILRKGSTVDGFIKTTVPVTISKEVLVTGDIIESAAFTPLNEVTWSVTFPDTSFGDVTLKPDEQRTIDPGRYGTLQVAPRATVTLAAGTYYFDTLTVNQVDGKIILAQGNGSTIVNVRGALTVKGTVVHELGDYPKVLFAYVGTQSVLVSSGFRGVLVAPNADAVLQLQAGGKATGELVGSFFAKSINVHPDLVIVHRALSLTDFFPPPPDNLGLDPDPSLDPVSQAGNNLGSGGIQPNPGYTPGQETCGPGLDVVTSVGPGVEVSSTLVHATGAGCHIAYAECDEQNGSRRSPSEAELNQPATQSDVCEGIEGRFPCGIDESTIDFSPTGLCETHAECAGRGHVCALVCSSAECTSSVQRCAQLSPSCLGLPEESLCIAVRECAEDNATGSSDPSQPHQMKNQPQSTLTEDPTPDPAAVNPPTSDFPETYVRGDPCVLKVVGQGKIPMQMDPRDANAGNDKWGIFIHPEILQSGQMDPLPIGGEAAVNVFAEASLLAGAYVWDQKVNALDFKGTGQFQTCSARLERTAKVFGNAIDLGGAANFNETNQACVGALAARGQLGSRMKKALFDAVAVKAYFETAGATKELCDRTVVEFSLVTGELQFTGDCNDLVVQRAAVDHWMKSYRIARDAFVTNDAALSDAKQMLDEQVPPSPLGLFGVKRNFTAVDTTFPIPVGPATVTVEIEISGSWGVAGELGYERQRNPEAMFSTKTTLKPTFDATAFAYAGIGFGPVSFGVGGELLLVDLQIPLVSGMGLRQTPSADPRPVDFPLGPLAFAPTRYDWAADWVYGARAQLESLSGKIDLQARIRLLFFKKTFRKKLADWKGFERTYDFVGNADAPLSATPPFGTFEEEIAFVDPVWLAQSLVPPGSPTPTALPQSLGFAVCIPPPK